MRTFSTTRGTAILALLTVCTVLSACNNRENDGVRNGPQAVHPSGSALSQQSLVSGVSY